MAEREQAERAIRALESAARDLAAAARSIRALDALRDLPEDTEDARRGVDAASHPWQPGHEDFLGWMTEFMRGAMRDALADFEASERVRTRAVVAPGREAFAQGPGELSEEEAAAIAVEEVRAVREEEAAVTERGTELPPPGPEEIEEWERRRDERREG